MVAKVEILCIKAAKSLISKWFVLTCPWPKDIGVFCNILNKGWRRKLCWDISMWLKVPLMLGTPQIALSWLMMVANVAFLGFHHWLLKEKEGWTSM